MKLPIDISKLPRSGSAHLVADDGTPVRVGLDDEGTHLQITIGSGPAAQTVELQRSMAMAFYHAVDKNTDDMAMVYSALAANAMTSNAHVQIAEVPTSSEQH